MAYLGNDLQVAFPTYRNIDDISVSFNGVTTSFPLTVAGVAPIPAPINSQQCLISVNGVVQRPDDSGTEGFRLSGGNIIFASAPAGGVDFFGVILAGADYVNIGANFPSGTAVAPSITFDSDLDTGIYNPAGNQIGFTTSGVQRLVINSSGQISGGLGTAAAPVISFISDPNTGIYSPGADQVAISTGGSGRLFVDASGNISAGNSTAFGPLDIKTSAGKRIVYTSLADYASNGIIGLTDGGNETDLGIGGNNLRFFTAAIERLRITSAGLVGVGTSSPDANSQLHIVGSSYQPLYVNTTGVGGGGATFFRSGTQALYVGTAGSSWLSGSSTADGLVRAEANFVLATNGNSRAVTIDTSQRVGIGTSSPSGLLHVAGQIYSSGTGYTGTNSPTLRLINSTATTGRTFGINSADSGIFQVFDASAGDATRLCIDSSGRVGIGTTSPQELLHVNTGSSGGQVLRLSTNGADTGYLYQNSGAVVLGAYSTRILGFETNGSERARIDSSGRLLVGTSTSITTAIQPYLQVQGTGENAYMNAGRWSNDVAGPGFLFGKSRGGAVGTRGAVANDDVLGEIAFFGDNGTSFNNAASIVAVVDGAVTGGGANDMPGRLVFSTTADGASSPTERMRINKNGEILFGTSTTTNGCKLALVNTDATRKWGFGTIGTNTYFAVVDDTSGAGVQLNAGSTSWSTFSDERLKDNLAPIQDGLDKVSQLRAVTGRYKTDDINVSRSFLIAQDVQAVLPEAVDIMSDDMRTLSLKYTEVIPLLVSALKESKERIETLEAKVVALESA